MVSHDSRFREKKAKPFLTFLVPSLCPSFFENGSFLHCGSFCTLFCVSKAIFAVMEPIEKKQKQVSTLFRPGFLKGTLADSLFYFGTCPEILNVILRKLDDLDAICLFHRLLISEKEREDQLQLLDPLVVTMLPLLHKMVMNVRCCLDSCQPLNIEDYGNLPHSGHAWAPLLGPSIPERCFSMRSTTLLEENFHRQYFFPVGFRGEHNECQIILDFWLQDQTFRVTRMLIFSRHGHMKRRIYRNDGNQLTITEYQRPSFRAEAHVPQPERDIDICMLGFEELRKFSWELPCTLQRWAGFYHGHRFLLDEGLYIRRSSPLHPSGTRFHPMKSVAPGKVLAEMDAAFAIPEAQMYSTCKEAEKRADGKYFFFDEDRDPENDSDDDADDPDFLP